jgi:uncharacterized protein (TIGR00297 family)
VTWEKGVARQMRVRALQGLVLAAGIATAAGKMHALSTSGAVAAILVGAAVHAGMGVRGSVATVSYFASASALGRLPGQKHSVQQRGNRRDAVQVLANGGPAACFSLFNAQSSASFQDFAATAFYGSLAAATADTWATEVGTRWGGLPRSIATGRQSLPGESGAVTPVGLAASVMASLAIAALARPGAENPQARAISCALGGVAGSVTDSLLGALVQEQRWCEKCGVRTEFPVHTCGDRTTRVSGVPRLNNDAVNFLGVFVGGLSAATVSAVLQKLTGRNGSRVEFATTLTNSPLPGDPGAA